MGRKRVTQLLPFLLPLRKSQRCFCFYAKMKLDCNRYAKTVQQRELPFCMYESDTRLLNDSTGFDMQYQRNKVFNLHLAAEPVHMVLIRPRETFSFWQLVRKADRKSYREGLAVVNGELGTVQGGGLCHLSNFLFWLFLHTPLAILERHAHKTKDFPSPDPDEPDGVDATVSEGWSDLKVQNQTDMTFQIVLCFDESHLHGRILTSRDTGVRYGILNREKRFLKRDDHVFEKVTVVRQEFDAKTGQVLSERPLYTNECMIGYPMEQKPCFTHAEE